MQEKTRLVVSEAKYIRSSHSKMTEKKRVHKTQRIITTAVVCLCCAFLIFGGIKVVSASTAAYQIVVDGEELATLTSEKEARAAINKFLEDQADDMGFPVVCGDNVSIAKVSSRDAVYYSTKEATAMLAENVEVLAKAVAICINSQPVMYVRDEETARAAVELSKRNYGDTDMEDVESVSVLEQVRVIASNVEPSQILSMEEATNMLLYGDSKVEFHFVETEGETFDYIAHRYGITVADIQAANPNTDSTNMAVGEAVLISRAEPLINIQVKRVIMTQEKVAYSTERRDNNQLPRGETKIIVEGEPGLEKVTTELIERNGVVASANRVSAVTLLEPVNRVEEFGTRRAVVASRTYTGNLGNGILAWPYRGKGMSSRFGLRSLGYHSGIDIQGPMGDVVAAAADGEVTLSEWYGGYGHLIIIEHGNGMETWYGHLSAYAVNRGEKVKRGQVI
ncbi:MAG: peptidoglycan DD-metalloendopeptidase family protein, partial [Clostridiales bacterium]|nr:peptidoglycan DD-metalloendopeptidase family protein [Clostridiales bacterium]